MQQQVHGRTGATTGDDTPVLADDLRRVQVDLGIAATKEVGEGPVRGGAYAFKQAGFSQHECRRTHRGDHGALPVLLTQPRSVDGEGWQGVLEGEEESRDHHQVGSRDIGDGPVNT
ncbi:hypothetical protein D3C73_873970 [compost metagenome]